MKTGGQIVYEAKNPKFIRVVPVDRRLFATEADVLLVPNERHVPWHLLTERCRQSWEETAKGHYLNPETQA